MWFKRVLLGYCAASLAVTFVAASITKDSTVPKKQHVVERLIFPLLERRQQPFQNQTSSAKPIESASSVATTSSAFSSLEVAQTSTIVNTPSIVITPSPSSSFTHTPSTTEPSSLLSGPSSDNDVTSLPSRTINIHSVTSSPASSTAEQHPSKTSVFTSSQAATFQETSSLTTVDMTSIISSSTDGSQSSSTAEIFSSAPRTTSNGRPTASSEAIASSKTMTIPSVTSTLVPTADPSQAPGNTFATTASESTASSVAIEAETSAVLIPTSQITAKESSNIAISPSTEPTTPSFPLPTASIEQHSNASFTSSSAFISNEASSAAVSDAITSIIIGSLSSLLRKPLSTSSNEQALGSTSLSAPSSSSGFQELSSTMEKILPTLVPQSPTLIATSSDASSMTLQTVTASTAVTLSLMSSAMEPSPSSITSTLTSVIEMPQLSPLPSSLETTLVFTTIVVQSSLSLSSQQSLVSSLAESALVSSDTISTLQPSVDFLSQTTHVPLSTVTLSFPTVSSSEKVLSSSLLESTHVIKDVSSMSTQSTKPSNPATTTEITSDAQSSKITAASSEAVSIPTQIGSLLTESNAPTSGTLVVSTGPGSLISTGLSQGTTSTVTTEPSVDSSTAIAASLEAIATGLSSLTGLPLFSLGTSMSASATSEMKISSFAPSEIHIASATSLVGSSSETSSKASQIQSSSSSQFSGTQPSFSEGTPGAIYNTQHSASSTAPASESKGLQSQASNTLESVPISTTPLSTPSSSTPILPSFLSGTPVLLPQNTTLFVVSSSSETYTRGTVPTSEVLFESDTVSSSSRLHSLVTPTPSGISYVASSSVTIAMSQVGSPSPSSVVSNSTPAGPVAPTTLRIVTGTFSTIYSSSIRSSAIDLSTVAFSLLNSVTGAAVNQTGSPVSNTRSIIYPSTTSRIQVPASETLKSSDRPSIGENSTWSLSMQPSLSTSTGLPGQPDNSTTRTTEFGITFSRSALPSDIATGTASSLNATQAEILQTSSKLDPANSSSANSAASVTSTSESGAQTGSSSPISASGPETESTMDGVITEPTNTVEATSTPSQTSAAGNPPPLTTSQTAGVAVGGTTFLLVAVVAAIFIARRYHAAKHGKRMSTGSVYPKVAYLYDPKTGRGDGDAEALMSGGIGGMPPGGSASRAVQGSPKHTQRHSTGTMSMNCFTYPGNSFRGSIKDPTIHRYSESEHVRMDTARALSAAVAGYAGIPRQSSSYTKYPSNNSNAFSDHVIPSPTFTPFSPDDIRRPELKRPHSTSDGRGEYSQMSVNPYAYLNTAASIYPPVSPYGRPPSHGLSPTYNMNRHTVGSNPFADPFEHDLLLQVDERDRTSDSVTIFAPSPNLVSPHTPRTPVGPKLPVRQPNGMTSARSLLSPVAAKYMHKAQEVKIPRKSIASPVLVQVRSPVIKPFSPPPAAPEPLGWEEIKRHSEKRYSDERSVPAPLKFASPVIKKKPVPSSHTRTKPSLTGAGQALLAGNGLPLAVKIPYMYNKSVGMDVPRVHGNPNPSHEDVSNDPIVREKRSRELRFADPTLIGKEF